ncbi:MAG: HAD family hydrolase [Myxococcota bacterium]|nr:haloacid dehalogenase-like hydrolase [Myxococcota bacterium]
MRRTVVVAALLTLAACGGSPDPHKPTLDTAAFDTALKALIEKPSAQRTIADFDVTHDQRVDANDLSAVDGLVARAKVTAETRGIDASTAAGIYEGGTFILERDASLPKSADTAAARAFVIEAQWLADQARFAAVVDWEPDALVVGSLARHIPGYNGESMSPPTLCLAIDTLDLLSFKRAGLPAVAVTDLDFTLWQGDISNVFLAVLADKKLAKPEANAAVIELLVTISGIDAKKVREASVHDNLRTVYERATDTTLPKEQRVSIKDAFFLTSKVIAGLEVSVIEEAAQVVLTKGAPGAPSIMSRFHADASGCGTLAVLGKLKTRGIEVYFLSATLDVLAKAAARAVGIPEDHAIGSALEVVDGRYTGQVVTSLYEIKGPVLRQWVRVPPLMVFGDSPVSDLPMMIEAVGTGFMVNPRQELLDKDKEVAQGRLVQVNFTPGDRRADARR